MSFLDTMSGHAMSAHEKADSALRILEQQGQDLSRLVEIQEAETQRSTAQRIPFVIDVDATGSGVAILQVPQGLAWDMVSFAIVGNQAGNFSIYMGSMDGNGLIFSKPIVVGTNLRATDIFAGEEYVPQGGTVYLFIEGQQAVSQVRGNLKVNVLSEGHAQLRD